MKKIYNSGEGAQHTFRKKLRRKHQRLIRYLHDGLVVDYKTSQFAELVLYRHGYYYLRLKKSARQ